jgi:hypothetical protein
VIAKQGTRQERMAEMLKTGVKRWKVAQRFGCSVNVVRKLAIEFMIGADGKVMKEQPDMKRGPFMVAAKRFGGDAEVTATEIGRLMDTVPEGETAPPEEEIQETADALAVPVERVRDVWKQAWGPLLKKLRSRMVVVDDQMLGAYRDVVDQVPDLTFEEQAWIEVDDADECELIIKPRLEEITAKMLEFNPRQPVDPRKRMIEFALKTFNTANVGTVGRAVFTESN